MKILNKIVVLFATLVVAYFTSPMVGDLYKLFFPGSASSYVNMSSLIGLPISYIFFLILLFSLFGDEKKYWWIGILLIPALAFELYFDLEHIYFPIILGIVGWLLAQAILKLKPKSQIGQPLP